MLTTTTPPQKTIGAPEHLATTGSYLAALSARRWIRVFRGGGREIREVDEPGLFRPPNCPEPYQVQQIGVSFNGAVVSLQLRPPKHLPQAQGAAEVAGSMGNPGAAAKVLYLYMVEQDTVTTFDFGARGRVPLGHAWDAREPRLVCVDTCADVGARGGSTVGAEEAAAGGGEAVEGPARAIALLFVDPSVGGVLQELQRVQEG